MKKLIILCLGIIGIFLIVQCSKFNNNTEVYVDTQLEGNHDDENERKIMTMIQVKKVKRLMTNI
ncbi:hypothetical protein ABEY01_08380 [Bacillus velezensis]|uniref:hypothetical protein n=1 Tax=Bacillus TaxID=1386 RepID=UPI001FF0D8DA|nr:hypothetical protein [Bacillus amyloliquefaciens]